MNEKKEQGPTQAVLSYLPSFSGDGYGYGGGIVIAFGDIAVNVGEACRGERRDKVAHEIVERYNLHDELLEQRKLLTSRCVSLETDKDAMVAQCEALRAAGERLLELFAKPDEDGNSRFERLAELFHRETGCCAPGKDVSAASGDSMSVEERRERWDAWYAERVAKARTALSMGKLNTQGEQK